MVGDGGGAAAKIVEIWLLSARSIILAISSSASVLPKIVSLHDGVAGCTISQLAIRCVKSSIGCSTEFARLQKYSVMTTFDDTDPYDSADEQVDLSFYIDIDAPFDPKDDESSDFMDLSVFYEIIMMSVYDVHGAVLYLGPRN